MRIWFSLHSQARSGAQRPGSPKCGRGVFAFWIGLVTMLVVIPPAAEAAIPGRWSKPTRIVRDLPSSAPPQIAAGPGRYTVVRWYAKPSPRAERPQDFVIVRQPDGNRFGAPQRVAPRGAEAQLEMNAAGETMLWWYDPQSDRIEAAFRSSTANWSEPTSVSDELAQRPRYISASLAPDNGALIAWRSPDGATIQAALKAPEGGFQNPVTLTEDGYERGLGVDVTLASGGNGALAWQEDCEPFTTGVLEPSLVSIIENGEFGEPAEIDNSECPGAAFSLAMDASGRALIMVNNYGSESVIKRSDRAPNGGFGRANQLDSASEGAFRAGALTTPDGEAAIAWTTYREGGGRPTGARVILGPLDDPGAARRVFDGNSLISSGADHGLAINSRADTVLTGEKITPSNRLIAAFRPSQRSKFGKVEAIGKRLPFNRLLRTSTTISRRGTAMIAWSRNNLRGDGAAIFISERRTPRNR